MSPLKGNAALRVTTAAGVPLTHLLNAPLKLRPVVAHNTRRYVRESLDLTAREVISVGSGRGEYEADLRFEPNVEDLLYVLTEAANGQTLTYYPDLTTGTGYDMWLVNDRDIVGVVGDGDRYGFGEYQGRVRFRDASASGQSLQAIFSPLLFRMNGGVTSRFATFTRSGSVGKYTDLDGVLRDAAANIERIDVGYESGALRPSIPRFLVEAVRTNIQDEDALSAWTANGSPTVTPAIDDPADATSAYTVGTGGGGVYSITNVVPFTGGAGLTRCAVFVVRARQAPSGQYHMLRIYDATAAAVRLEIRISDWDIGEVPAPTGAVGTFLGQRYLGNGYWAIYGQTTSAVTSVATTNQVEIYAANGTGAAGEIDVYRVNVYDTEMPLWSVLDVSEVKAVETWYEPYLHDPQVNTLYVKMVEAGSADDDVDGAIIHIGGASAASDPRLVLTAVGGVYVAVHDDGAAASTATLAAAPSFGEEVELRVVLNEDGTVEIGQSIEGAAETTAVGASGPSIQPAWADQRIYIGSRGTTSHGVAVVEEVKNAPGVKTMAEMRAL